MMPSDEVATIVPFASVVRSDDGMRKSVVEPTLFTLKSVEVAVPAEEEPIAKRVEAACDAKLPPVKRERSAYGLVVPTPTLLLKLLTTNFDVPTVSPPLKVDVAVEVVAVKNDAST